MGALTSMNIFLRQEVDRMQRVITTVRNTLVDLKLAIDGTIIMSENLKDALDNIYDARVPALWKKVNSARPMASGPFRIRISTFSPSLPKIKYSAMNTRYIAFPL